MNIVAKPLNILGSLDVLISRFLEFLISLLTDVLSCRFRGCGLLCFGVTSLLDFAQSIFVAYAIYRFSHLSGSWFSVIFVSLSMEFLLSVFLDFLDSASY